jgi:hypothetical protein
MLCTEEKKVRQSDYSQICSHSKKYTIRWYIGRMLLGLSSIVYLCIGGVLHPEQRLVGSDGKMQSTQG